MTYEFLLTIADEKKADEAAATAAAPAAGAADSPAAAKPAISSIFGGGEAVFRSVCEAKN